jgi:hypothetical protein
MLLKNFTLIACLLCAVPAFAEVHSPLVHPKPGARPSKLWRLSIGALAMGSAADAWSSHGRMEANPILSGPSGRFAGRAIGIKVATVGIVVGAQWLAQRRHSGTARAAAVTNFAMAGLFSGVAIRNARLETPHRGWQPPR